MTGSQRFILDSSSIFDNLSRQPPLILGFQLCDVIIDGIEDGIGGHVEGFGEAFEHRGGGGALTRDEIGGVAGVDLGGNRQGRQTNKAPPKPNRLRGWLVLEARLG